VTFQLDGSAAEANACIAHQTGGGLVSFPPPSDGTACPEYEFGVSFGDHTLIVGAPGYTDATVPFTLTFATTGAAPENVALQRQ
jgi:hypothetical protein